MDRIPVRRKNGVVFDPEASRRQLARALNCAYAEGLISDETFAFRLDHVMRSSVIDPKALVGDLTLRDAGGLGSRIGAAAMAARKQLAEVIGGRHMQAPALLALDWSGHQKELIVGRSCECDVVFDDLSVSRRHARLVFRDGRWVLQDLDSTNGTTVNGRLVGRCELRPGDSITLGNERLRVD